MIDLASVAERKSVTVSDLKRRAAEIHREVSVGRRVYTLRFGEHEDMAVVSLADLVALAREHAELREEMRLSDLQRLTQAGVPVLGGPDEDDIIRERLRDPRPDVPGEQVLAAARAKLGLDP